MAYSSHETHDIVALFDQPGQNTGGIKASAVGKANPLFSRHDEGAVSVY